MDQTAWLETQISAFTDVQGSPLHVRTAFWEKVYRDWVAQWPVVPAPPSLGPQANATEISAAAKEHIDAVDTLNAVRAYMALSLQS